MKIRIEAETPEDEKNLRAKEVEYRGVHSACVVVRCMQGGLVPKEFSLSFGDALYLIGKMYVTMKILEKEIHHADTAGNRSVDS